MNAVGTISVEVVNPTSVVMSVTGYWKMPTAADTGLGLHVLDAPERLVDTTTGAGTCDGVACGRLTVANTTVAAAGHAGIPGDSPAIMVAVNVINPATTGLVGVGAGVGESAGGFIFNTGEEPQASFITALSDTGTLNVNAWAATDLTVDVIGYFTAPTRTYHYTYDTTGLRASKSLDGYIYLRARHDDPTASQFTTLDPLVAVTEEPYGCVGGDPANGALRG